MGQKGKARYNGQTVASSNVVHTAVSQTKGISDELRQAVKDLGGDEEDLKLIAGIDEDDESEGIPSIKGKSKASDEVNHSLTTRLS